MRKFVNKKRQKRKYTKKSEVTSSYSSAKTAYGVLPLIIMLIAFMSTLVISAPLRDSLENIKFTFELPHFSFSNPLIFFQTAWGDVTQISFVLWIIGKLAGMTIVQSLLAVIANVQHGTIFISNVFIMSSNGVLTSLVFISKEFLFGIQLIGQGITFILSQCSHAINFCLQAVATAAITVGQFIARVTVSVTNTALQFSLILIHFIVTAAIAVAHFVVSVTTVIWKTLVYTTSAIGNFFTRIATAIVHVIEIPFKTLYAFWLVIKPYADIFGNHVKMSGSDFSNMFTSFDKISSMVGASK